MKTNTGTIVGHFSADDADGDSFPSQWVIVGTHNGSSMDANGTLRTTEPLTTKFIVFRNFRLALRQWTFMEGQ